MQRKDKMIEEKTKKSKKKSKKSKKPESAESDSDDIKQTHLVNRAIELPEGATLSDNDNDKNELGPNDPHRALDINLDIEDEFQAQRNWKEKSISDGPAKIKEKSLTRKIKDDVLEEDDTNDDRKKHKKKHKRKKVLNEDLLNVSADVVEQKTKKSKKSSLKETPDDAGKARKHKKSSKRNEYEETF